ncbi:unnamed protein product [Amoebophrya sp. A25]|nr:unnamed protein product [Amoebophrya sp. A25]|eukprot:GSA25T00000464001.1
MCCMKMKLIHHLGALRPRLSRHLATAIYPILSYPKLISAMTKMKCKKIKMSRRSFFVFLQLGLAFTVTPVAAFLSGVTQIFGYLHVDNSDDYILYGYSERAGGGRHHGHGHVRLESLWHCVTNDFFSSGRLRETRPQSIWRTHTRSTGYRETTTTYYITMDAELDRDVGDPDGTSESRLPTGPYERDCTAEELTEAADRIANAKWRATRDVIISLCLGFGILAVVFGSTWIVSCCKKKGKCGGQKDTGKYGLASVSSTEDEDEDLEKGEINGSNEDCDETEKRAMLLREKQNQKDHITGSAIANGMEYGTQDGPMLAYMKQFRGTKEQEVPDHPGPYSTSTGEQNNQHITHTFGPKF